jgi:hypothetical protein
VGRSPNSTDNFGQRTSLRPPNARILLRTAVRPRHQTAFLSSGTDRSCPLRRCVASVSLSELSKPLITSIVYSYDFVSRLSLGSIRDLKRVSEWLMFAVDDPDQKCNSIVSKALRIKAGGIGMTVEQKQMEADWVGLGIRRIPRLRHLTFSFFFSW